jgi:hypothetical protein
MATAPSPAAAPKAHSESFNPSTAQTRLNSLQHGATSKQLFIPGENPEAFLSMLQENFHYYKPVTEQQAALVEDATIAHWHLARVQRVHNENEFNHYTAKPEVVDWTDQDMDRLNKFDRYKTQAERSLQRALANVLAFQKENVRSRQWQQLHELRKQKFDIQRERFELAKAREARLAAKSQTREKGVANKADSEIRFAKNAFSSPQKNTPEPPEPNIKPAASAKTAPNAETSEELLQ